MPRPTIDDSVPLTHLSDVRFGEAAGRPLLLNAVFPQGEPRRPRPAVVFVGLAGWYASSRENVWFSPYLATHGFFAVTIDVRVSGEVRFPAQVHDVKAAVRWLRANATRYDIDPGHIGGIWGTSSGAHLAALAAVTGDLPQLEGESGSPGHSSRVQAVAWCSGAADFLRPGGEIRNDVDGPVTRLFGGTVADKEASMRLGSPITHVGPAAPPFLIVHGTADETTPFAQAEALHAALVSAGVEAELVPLERRTHSWTAQIDPPGDA
jgi:acetyl esterase/lipase